MKVIYRGFEIEAKRERALGGWDNLYFYVMRISDGWFLQDAFTEGSDRIQTFIKDLKGDVDHFYAHPEEYEEESWAPLQSLA